MTSATHKNGSLLSRREFLALSTVSAGAVAAGCATNPVTGNRQFMLVSEAEEIGMDRQYAPHQFSADYGPVQDAALNGYIAEVGGRMAATTHRPDMPYSFRAVNAVVVNGYTFPAGSVALARGLMLAMESEAELAAVLGHELGHVNARHTAERMTMNMVTSLLVAGAAAYVAHEKEEYPELAAGLGVLGSSLLLARYSRDDEREADGLGLEYASRGGHNPSGMVDLMDTFRSLHKSRPGAVELLFSTHPMSDERYRTAREAVVSRYADASGRDPQRERYMDNTHALREQREAIEAMQRGQTAMAQHKVKEAEGQFTQALKAAPDDYAGLLMMAKCMLAQKRNSEARDYARRARDVYPEEAQALHVHGLADVAGGRFDRALSSFSAYEQRLPGNANTIFYRAYCLDRTEQRSQAAAEYVRYLESAPGGEFSQAAQSRLTVWGVGQGPGQGRY